MKRNQLLRRFSCCCWNGKSLPIVFAILLFSLTFQVHRATAQVCLTCSNVTNGGTIACDEARCCGYDPALITNVNYPCGGSGALEYIWLSSTDNFTTSSVIPGACSSTYDPCAITQTTWYKRLSRRHNCTNYVGCSNIVVKRINPSPTVCITTNGSCNLCSGGSVQLCASSGSSYSWSTGATTQCINATSSGNYCVTVTNSYGCTGSASRSVTVNSPTSCSISGCNTVCTGQTTTLCAPSGCSYSWSNGATTRCICVGAGTYSVTVTNSNGCTSTCSRTVTASAPPSCTITGGTSCCQGESITLSAPLSCSSYLWSNGATTRCITVTCSGTYTVCVANSNGCSSSCSICVTVHTPPGCSITGCNSICQGQTTTICAPASCASYHWNTGATTRCIDVTTSGTYTVTVTNSHGCSSTSTRSVTVSGPPSCSITGNNSICDGQSTTLTAEPNCASYLWSNGATTQCITVSCAGTYTVTVTNNNGCSSTCSRCVTVYPQPSSCISGNTHLWHGWCTTLSAPSGCSTYSWSNGATTRCITVWCPGNYCVTVTNSNGCSSSSSVCVTWYSCRTSSKANEQVEQDPNMETFGTMEALVFPNPFNSTATFQFKNHGESANTVVEIFDVAGAKVAEIFNNAAEANELYKVDWNPQGLPNGMYLYRITSGDQVVNGRLIHKD